MTKIVVTWFIVLMNRELTELALSSFGCIKKLKHKKCLRHMDLFDIVIELSLAGQPWNLSIVKLSCVEGVITWPS